ncbi:unnamed protein product [Cylindrotheca closterium]|uniref:Uncharacterized protein n=1 Tax=Cylindrotheca closterium TaxID=2856 RepID=A0AAD2FJK8_9STRA|nr:unnamed protein product [Cylindrotheca closterium]
MSSSSQILDKVTMISPASPGAASPKDEDFKPQQIVRSSENSKPAAVNQQSPMKKSDTRTLRFAQQQRIKPISNSFLASDKIRSALWYPVQELEERERQWKNETPNNEILKWEEGLFFLQMLDRSHMEAPQDDWSPKQEERVQRAINAVLSEQGRQNQQLQLQQLQLQQPHQQKPDPTPTEIGISAEEKDRLGKRDQTPLFMIAIQYSWHTGTAAGAAKHRAIQLAMEIQRLWQDEDTTATRKEEDGQDKVSIQDEEEKKEEKEVGKVQQMEDEPDSIEKEDTFEEESSVDLGNLPEKNESVSGRSLADGSDEAPKPVRPRGIFRGNSDHSALSDIGGLQKKGSSRSVFSNSYSDPLLDPEDYLGDWVHLALPTKFAGKEHPQISATLKKQRSRARLSARSLALKEDIQVSGTKMRKNNVLKSIHDRGAMALDKGGRKEAFQDCVKKLITLNRFFQSVEGVSKDRALDTDKKKFLEAIAAKKSNIFHSMEIPDNIHEPAEETKLANKGAPIQVHSILLSPAIKALRPKHKVVWGEKLHRVKFFPEFPLQFEKEEYFYTSEDISRFRFEKFMEDNNDEYEEQVMGSNEEKELEALNEEGDGDESSYEYESYEELSYHSDSDESYYEEELAEPVRDLANLSETQSVSSEGRRLSL